MRQDRKAKSLYSFTTCVYSSNFFSMSAVRLDKAPGTPMLSLHLRSGTQLHCRCSSINRYRPLLYNLSKGHSNDTTVFDSCFVHLQLDLSKHVQGIEKYFPFCDSSKENLSRRILHLCITLVFVIYVGEACQKLSFKSCGYQQPWVSWRSPIFTLRCRHKKGSRCCYRRWQVP